jgi:2-aminoadipate transaminase
MDRLLVAKQAADLHTSNYLQCVTYQYLCDNDIDEHIRVIRECYGRQCRAMVASLDEFLPAGTTHTHPEGGMFIWATLPEGISARALLELALRDKVIFVPGDPFYVNRKDTNTMRLNFSCMDEPTIRTGIERLGNAVRKLLS